MHNIKFNNRNYTGASKWNELDEKQLIAFAKLSLKKLDIEAVGKLLLCIVYKIPFREFYKLKRFQIVQLVPTVTYLIDGSNNLNLWLIKSLTIRKNLFQKQILLGPNNRLANITIKEFRYTEFFYQAYQRQTNENYLDQLIAALYRPEAKTEQDTDRRKPILELEINTRAKQISKLPKAVKQAILLNYEGCRNFIHQKYIQFVFRLTQASGETAIKEIYDYDQMIQAVSGSKFGTYKETTDTLIFPFFDHLSLQIEQAEKSKSK